MPAPGWLPDSSSQPLDGPRRRPLRIAGFPVQLDLGAVVLGALFGWTFAVAVLPSANDDVTGSAQLVLGLLAGTGFVGSILVHELAHAVVARRRGVAVHGIRLWLLGGVAELAGEARRPRHAAAIAAAGPGASLVVGAVLVGAATGLDRLAPQAGLAVLASWLGVMNLALGAFNLLPGLPLDGGRLLQAAWWAARRDRLRATEVAGGAGRLLGFGLVAFGVLELTRGAGGLWTMLVGWMIATAARAEVLGARAERRHGDRVVADVMVAAPRLAAWESPAAARQALAAHPGADGLVVDDGAGRPLGLVVGAAAATGAWDAAATVADLAHDFERMRFVAPQHRLRDVEPLVAGAPGGLLVVWDGARVVGLVPAATWRAAAGPAAAPPPPPPPPPPPQPSEPGIPALHR